jgi:hypothetical protein
MRISYKTEHVQCSEAPEGHERTPPKATSFLHVVVDACGSWFGGSLSRLNLRKHIKVFAVAV